MLSNPSNKRSKYWLTSSTGTNNDAKATLRLRVQNPSKLKYKDHNVQKRTRGGTGKSPDPRFLKRSTARKIVEAYAEMCELDLPLFGMVHALLSEKIETSQAVELLMGRPLRHENTFHSKKSRSTAREEFYSVL